MFIEILLKMLLFKGGVLIYAEHCIYNSINAGAGLGLAAPSTTAASVSFFSKSIAFI